MCMITYLPPFVQVPISGITNGGSWNDDGHGWAIAAGTGHMVTGRYLDLETALETFILSRDAYPHAPAVFHSRWATHGEVTVKNVHPFFVGGKDTVVAHNGVLPSAFHPISKDTRSDTAIMAQEWLKAQSKGTWTKKERKRVGALIGQGNKLAILSVSPKLDKPRGWLVNGHRGEWVRGAWFSNGDHSSYWSRGRTTTTSGLQIVRHASNTFASDDECPWCFSTGHIDSAVNVCLWCDTCLDCMSALRDCLCSYPSQHTPETEVARDPYTSPPFCRDCQHLRTFCTCEEASAEGLGWATSSKAVEPWTDHGEAFEGWSR